MNSLPIDPSIPPRRPRTRQQGAALGPPEYTIQEAAAKLGIAEQKLRRWDAQGVLVARRTEGGHRRYAREIVDGLAGSVNVDFQKQGSENDELARARQDIKEKRRIIQLLIESESRYRDLVETSHDLIWTTDAVGRFTYLNNGTVDIFGLEPNALIGRCFFDFEARPSHVSNRRFLSTLRKDGEVKDYLTHLIAADGSDRWVGINARVWYDNGRIIGLRGTARNVTEQHRAALQIEHLATHDALTGLPNQVSLMRAVEEALADGEFGALLRIDIDRFRRFNEDYGHRTGDQLLIAVAGILRNLVTDKDATVYRENGDQFAVNLTEATSQDAESFAEAALHALRQFTPKLERSPALVRITGSIGIAMYPSQAGEIASLLDNVEHAVTEAQANGGDGFVTYKLGPAEAETLERLAYWKQELRGALDEDRLVLYAQDMISLTASGARHKELLARIVSRNGEIIEPRQFIGVADSIGLAQEIDLRVTEKVMEFLGKDNGAADNVRYFVNLSRSSVLDPSWHPRLHAALSAASFDTGRLVFEISEATAMSNIEMAKKVIGLLKDAGCGCALDNFGTGFSSMYYLKQFDVDYLKVDGTVVRELANDEASRLFIRALCDVTRGLGKEVIAEKVESPNVLAELQALGIEYAQGHYIARPSPFITLEGSATIVKDDDVATDGDSPTAVQDAVEP
ncbi:MAG: EAL domain-containing protein [Betaproteobacteria bacterium]|nr:MAG: EAL domain-containing protein [Betaproteobacteria bacterium]